MKKERIESFPLFMKTRILSLILASFLCPTLWAGTIVTDSKVVYDTPEPESEWQVGIEIYSWAAGLGGDVSLGGFEYDFGYGFGDILQELDMAGFVTANVRYRRFSFLGDVMYLKLSPTANPTRAPFLTSNLGIHMVIANGIGLYRVWDGENGFLDIGGGIRYVYNQTKATTAGLLIPPRFSSSTIHSLNGVAALHTVYHWTPRFYTGLYGDVGAGDANITWQALGSVNYKLTDNFTASLGFRWLQFKNDRLDIAMFGPYAGLVIWF